MDRFDEVEALDTESLRGLLTKGSAQERVWAAWALGLRLGSQAWPELARASRQEPDPGTRRHLLVILAGYRDIDLLAVMARDDPDGYVRASACQYLAQVAPDDPAVRALLRERLTADPFTPVRYTVIQHLTDVRPEDLPWAARAARDEDFELRSAALDVLVRMGPRATAMLRERASQEPDSTLRQAAMRKWLEAAGVPELLSACVTLPVDRAAEVLRLLAGEVPELSWARLAPIAARQEPKLDMLLLDFLQGKAVPTEARLWLEDLLLRAFERRDWVTFTQCGWKAYPLLTEALRALPWEELPRREQARLAQVRQYLEEELPQEDTDEECFYEDEDCWGPRRDRELLELLRKHS
jgi:HEAT repeat protein